MSRPTNTRPDATDWAACRSRLADGSRSFNLAACLLPRDLRDDASALYAFCRLADDAIDGAESIAHAERALREIQARLAAIYAGTPIDDPVDRAFAKVVVRHNMPYTLPAALIEGLSWDVRGEDYATLAELRDYAARVAGSVGVMMCVLMNRRDAHTLARAAELGVAMQLTNIARDVGEDAAMGRCYIPRAWRVDAGGATLPDDPGAWPGATLAALVQRLLAAARTHYQAAQPGMADLPLRFRLGMRAAAWMYADIGHMLGRQGYDSRERRAVVPIRRKIIGVLAAVIPGMARYGSRQGLPAAAETRFLVNAVARLSPTTADIQPEQLRWWQLSARWAWVIQLFGKLAWRERLDSERAATSNESSASSVSHQR